MEEQLFKILSSNGMAMHGIGQWHLPQDDVPGEWMRPIIGALIPCRNGYHLCRAQDLLNWLGPAIFEVECRGERTDHEDKIVVREARLLRKIVAWNHRSARLFACDCAEHTLYLYEKRYPNDGRPRRAIEITRQYALGEATHHQLVIDRSAAWSAQNMAIDRNAIRAAAGACAATRDVTWYAAWNAARGGRWAARQAAADAESDTAAKAAAKAAGENAEREWQTRRLLRYLYPGTVPT